MTRPDEAAPSCGTAAAAPRSRSASASPDSCRFRERPPDRFREGRLSANREQPARRRACRAQRDPHPMPASSRECARRLRRRRRRTYGRTKRAPACRRPPQMSAPAQSRRHSGNPSRCAAHPPRLRKAAAPDRPSRLRARSATRSRGRTRVRPRHSDSQSSCRRDPPRATWGSATPAPDTRPQTPRRRHPAPTAPPDGTMSPPEGARRRRRRTSCRTCPEAPVPAVRAAACTRAEA